MNFIQNILPLLKRKELSLLDHYEELEGVHTFLFEKEADLHWRAGQHGVFTILHEKIKKPTRPFSVASTPSENIVKISVGIGEQPSDFKRALLGMEKGMKIGMRGPIGPLFLREEEPVLLIAGGIGITPFRAILKEAESKSKKSRQKLKLAYLDSGGHFLYQEQLSQLSRRTSIPIRFLHSRNELYEEIETFRNANEKTGMYYLAGPKPMVDSVAAFLKKQNVPKRKIKKDPFWGY